MILNPAPYCILLGFSTYLWVSVIIQTNSACSLIRRTLIWLKWKKTISTMTFSSKSTNLEAIFRKIFSTCLSDPKLCSEDNYNCALRHCMLLYGPGLPKLLSTEVTKNWWQVEFFQETLHPSLTPASGEFAGFIIHYFHNATRNLLAAPALVIQHQRHCAN